MPTRIVVGLDGSPSGSRAVAHAKKLGEMIGECELLLVYVVEWSPFSFQTPEENEQRHLRREEEIKQALDRVVTPAVEALTKEGVKARGIVRHGDVADLLDSIAVEEGAVQIVIARTSETGIKQRIFGSSTANLVMHASVPVTVVV
jgi:nucleotide-binding universal stress UspA family protein